MAVQASPSSDYAAPTRPINLANKDTLYVHHTLMFQRLPRPCFGTWRHILHLCLLCEPLVLWQDNQNMLDGFRRCAAGNWQSVTAWGRGGVLDGKREAKDEHQDHVSNSILSHSTFCGEQVALGLFFTWPLTSCESIEMFSMAPRYTLFLSKKQQNAQSGYSTSFIDLFCLARATFLKISLWHFLVVDY